MKLIDGINNLAGTPAVIPDTWRHDFPQLLVELGLNVGAEVGVYKGAFTELFCQAGLQMYAVDPWRAFDGAGRSQKAQDRQDFLYEHTKRVLAPYDCTIIRKSSMEALEFIKDGSLDFVYIDGDHRFPYVAEDIWHWSHKVRKGGIVAGHDYFNTAPEAANVLCHVRVVVDAYVTLFNIEKWWLFGKQKVRPGSGHDSPKIPKDDRFYSWMWFKP